LWTFFLKKIGGHIFVHEQKATTYTTRGRTRLNRAPIINSHYSRIWKGR